MTMYEMFFGGGALLFIFMSLVEISPIKINPWKALGRAIGKTINQDVIGELNDLKAEVQSLKADVSNVKEDVAENAIIESRARILRFGDEIVHGKKHTKEHYQQILIDIDKYEDYCDTHKEFLNTITEITVGNIKAEYTKRLPADDFA